MIYLVLLSVALFCQAFESNNKNMIRSEFTNCGYSYLNNKCPFKKYCHCNIIDTSIDTSVDKNVISRYNRTNKFYDSIDSTLSPNTTSIIPDFLAVTSISPTIVQFNRILGTNATSGGDIVVIFLLQLMALLYCPVRMELVERISI